MRQRRNSTSFEECVALHVLWQLDGIRMDIRNRLTRELNALERVDI